MPECGLVTEPRRPEIARGNPRGRRCPRNGAFRCAFASEPVLRYRQEFGDQRGDGFGRDDLELAAKARDLPVRFLQLGTEHFDRKLVQRHNGLVAYSPHSEAKLAANFRRRFTDAEKNGPAAVARRFGCELAQEIAPAREWPDRIPQHDPAPPDDAEHHEAIACGVEEKAFVPEQCEVGPRLRRLCDDLGSPRQGVSTGDAGQGRSGGEQADSSGGKSDHRDCDGGSQEARGVAIKRKMPPQLVAVADLLVGEEPQPKGAAEDDTDRQKPPRRKGLGNERAAPIELVPARQENEVKQQQEHGLLPLQPVEQLRDATQEQQQKSDEPGRAGTALKLGGEQQQKYARRRCQGNARPR